MCPTHCRYVEVLRWLLVSHRSIPVRLFEINDLLLVQTMGRVPFTRSKSLQGATTSRMRSRSRRYFFASTCFCRSLRILPDT